MQFRLALALGFAHPDLMARTLTADQMADWEAFNGIDPIGGDRLDYAIGVLIEAVRAPYRREGSRQMNPFDYFPWHQHRREPLVLTPDEQVAAFDAMFM